MNRTLLVLSIAVMSSACAVVRAPTSPQAWKAHWLDQHRASLRVDVSAEPARPVGEGRVVILVPGMTISAEFFAPMAERLRRDGYRPIMVEDPALLTTGIEPAARRLAAKVEEVLATTGADSVDIVAECVGGVTSRFYVQQLGGARRVRHLVTFVSPHHGSLPAAFVANFTQWPGMHDITLNSELLSSLDRTPFPAGVAFTSIYSCSDGYLVPRDTAAVRGATNVELCGPRAVGHFDGFWDAEIYGHIVEGLLRTPGADDAEHWAGR